MSPGGIAFLSWKYLSHRPLRSCILVAAVALTIYLPLAFQVFTAESTEILQERARSTPLLVGPKGSSIDLTLNSLYFTPQELPALKFQALEDLRSHKLGTPIPLHVRFEARTGVATAPDSAKEQPLDPPAPIVGTSLEYFRHRNLHVQDGHMITRLGDCVIGARLARKFNLHPGDKLISSTNSFFDLAGVFPLRMRIAGVLAPNFSPDDQAVFVDLKTAWIMEGLAHGHQDLADPAAATAVRSRDGNIIEASPSVVEFNEVSDANLSSFHFHGDPADYPLSAVILIPDNLKSHTLALGAYQSETATEQIVVPHEALAKLTNTLFATERLVQTGLRLLGAATLVLAALVFLLSFRLREREMTTYAKIGATDGTVFILKLTEVAIVLITGALVAVAAILLTKSLAADLLVKLLQ